MAIKVLYEGRSGNNLFQYVFARLLAEQNGLGLANEFPYQKLLKTTPHAPGVACASPQRMIEEQKLPVIVNGDQVLDSAALRAKRPEYLSTYDLAAVFEAPLEPACYSLLGNFEYSAFYNPREKQIKSFFDLEPIEKNTEDLVMNVRLGDFARLGVLLHPQWYLSILAQEQFRQLYIVGAQPGEPYLKHFARYDPVIVPGDPVNDFHFIRKFDKIICSNSTYCWWAAFLSEASRIYTSDKWISALLYSCKDSIQVEAECLRQYTPTTWYGSGAHVKGFGALSKELLDRFVIPRWEHTEAAIRRLVILLSTCIESSGDRGRGFRMAIEVGQTGRYHLHCRDGACRVGEAEGDEADCAFTFPNAHTFIESLFTPDYLEKALLNGLVKTQGPAGEFLRRLNADQLEDCLDAVAREFVRPAEYPRYQYYPEDELLLRAGHYLREGAAVGWYQEQEDYGPEGLGDLWVVRGADPPGGSGSPGTGAAFKKYPALLHHVEADAGPKGAPEVVVSREGTGQAATLEQALHRFYQSSLDYLVLDGFIVKKSISPIKPVIQ